MRKFCSFNFCSFRINIWRRGHERGRVQNLYAGNLLQQSRWQDVSDALAGVSANPESFQSFRIRADEVPEWRPRACPYRRRLQYRRLRVCKLLCWDLFQRHRSRSTCHLVWPTLHLGPSESFSAFLGRRFESGELQLVPSGTILESSRYYTIALNIRK